MSSIVIIESDRLMRGLLVEWLSAAGYSVRVAEAPNAEALQQPNLVIVDVYMPRRAGANTLGAVKAVHPKTPLIAISGQFRAGLAGSCTTAGELGVDRVVAKPFTRVDLLAAVEGLIGPAGFINGARAG